MKKSFKIIGYLIVVAGVIGGGVWYWQKNKAVNNQPIITNQQVVTTTKEINQNSTSTWLTYKNDKYGFEFQYPQGFDLSEHNSNYVLNKGAVNEKIYQAINIELFSRNNYSIGSEIKIILNSDQSLNDLASSYVDMVLQNAELGSYPNFSIKSVVTSTEMVGGLNAEKIISNIDSIGVVIVRSGSNLYMINQSGLNNFDQIISTFKFIK